LPSANLQQKLMIQSRIRKSAAFFVHIRKFCMFAFSNLSDL